jgi:adenosylmethionine-8-amino-7-oxononanoate aminotransferase
MVTPPVAKFDAVGGAGTVVLGHGVGAITDAIARHGTEVSFSYGATFTNPWQEQLAEALVAMNPRVARRVYFTSGGSVVGDEYGDASGGEVRYVGVRSLGLG